MLYVYNCKAQYSCNLCTNRFVSIYTYVHYSHINQSRVGRIGRNPLGKKILVVKNGMVIAIGSQILDTTKNDTDKSGIFVA